jgi:hypothetical protein
MPPDTTAPITLADAIGPVYRCGPNITLAYSPAQLRELAAYRRRRAWDLFTTEVAREIYTWLAVCYQRVRAFPQSVSDRVGCWVYLLGVPRIVVQLRNQLLLLCIGARHILRRF